MVNKMLEAKNGEELLRICEAENIPLSEYAIRIEMEKAEITREEALKRWESAKKQKKAMVEKMRKALYEDYKARTGEEPLTFNVL